jgi:hypothetical protein
MPPVVTGFRTVMLVALLVALAACAQDHAPGVIEVQGDEACVACHLADYEQTTDPVHAGTKPTTCGDCHSTSSWTPALDGDHPESAFPIDSGPHERIACLDCHVPDLGPSTDGVNVSCIGCHTGEHSRAEMDDKHDEEPRYQWDEARPAFCRDCHPRGRE